MNSQDHAISSFRSGYNCAQSVLITYSEKYHIDLDTALSLSCGFGAGMGRLQETCGAVTGSFMAIGLHICSRYAGNKERKEHSYTLVREFERQFRNIHDTLKCDELLSVDLKTPEGQKRFHDDKLNEKVCEKCIGDAVEILENLNV
jgi:C_GCAxxG_C_C family probable redox protein